MPALNPEQLHQLFAEAFNARDMDAILALYEPDACMESAPDQHIEGIEGIRGVLTVFFTFRGQIRMETRKAVRTAGVGLLKGYWSLNGTAPDGSPLTLEGLSTEVVRQQPDGTWRYVIDLPNDP